MLAKERLPGLYRPRSKILYMARPVSARGGPKIPIAVICAVMDAAVSAWRLGMYETKKIRNNVLNLPGWYRTDVCRIGWSDCGISYGAFR